MGFWQMMENVDRRWIYTLLIAVIALALLKPVGLAITPSDQTKAAYNMIEKVPDGSTVWLGFEFSPGGIPELMGSATSVLRQGFRKNLKFVMGGIWEQSGNLAQQALNEVLPEFPDKKYGVDYINVGYKPGRDVLLQKFVVDAWAAFAGVDNYGKPLADFPIMANFKSAKDAKAMFIFCTGTPGENEYIKNVTDPLKIPLASCTISVSVPGVMPMLGSGQLTALVAGMKGSAEYEVLVNKPGKAVAGMDAQSFAHVLIILFIVFGNVGYIVQGGKKGAKRR